MENNLKDTAFKLEKEPVYWFAMSVPYNRVLKVKNILDQNNIECFVPMRYELRIVKGQEVQLYVPAISNLIFVHTTSSKLKLFKQSVTFLQYLVRKVDGISQKIIVPDKQMEQFIRVCSTNDKQLVFINPGEINLSKGIRVRIHGGAFNGVEGILVKVKGRRSRCVVVVIEHVSAIVVSEISQEMIEIIS